MPRRRGPLTPDETVRWGVSTLLAAVVCGFAWYQASGRALLVEQYTPATIGVLGLIVLGYASFGVIFRGRRALAERRQDLMARSATLEALLTVDIDAPAAVDGPPVSDDDPDVLVGGDLRFYHRSNCLLAAGRDLVAGSRAEHEAAGREPCGVCAP